MNNTFGLVIFAIIINLGCNGSQSSNVQEIPYNLDPSQPALKNAYRYYNLGILDSASFLLTSANPNERIYGIRTFSNWENNSSLDSLFNLLRDPLIEVRREAIYALGQIGDERAVRPIMDLFAETDTSFYDEMSFSIALEAIGKLGDEELMNFMTTVDTYRADDLLLLRGRDLGLFQFLLRGIYNEQSVDHMIAVLDSVEISENKIIAAQYLSRLPSIPTNRQSDIIRIYQSLPAGSNRINLIRALGKINSAQSIQALANSFGKAERNEKLAILDAFQSASYNQIKDIITPLFTSDDRLLATKASELCPKTASTAWGKQFFGMVTRNYPWYVKSNLLAATNRYFLSPQAFVNINRGYIQTEINTAANKTQKLAFIKAFAYSNATAPRLYTYFNSEDKVKMAEMIQEAVEGGFLPTNPTLVDFVKSKLMASKDIALMSIGAQMALSHQSIRNQISESEIKSWQDACSLPQMSEPFVMLKKLEQAKQGSTSKRQFTFSEIKPKFFTPQAGEIKATVQTTKGSFTINLLNESAPVSVSNFIELAESGFFTDKSFHRVVPNFVIQTGDPRGDMYGSLDYNIPTETPPSHYFKKGMVGMASGGRNTESCQWFVTLGPTLHLDGKYTLFGEVISGLDVLDKITTDDEIQSVQLTYENLEVDEENAPL